MHDGAAYLEQTTLLSLLDDIGIDLAARGVQAEIAVFGGAAMILSFPHLATDALAAGTRDVARRVTRDVDVMFCEPEDASDLVGAAADRAGVPRGLAPGWLNDAVVMFASDCASFVFYGDFPRDANSKRKGGGDDPGGGLRVTLASPQYLFAMKMLAMRSSLESSDPQDIWNLIDPCGIDGVEAAERLVARFYPDAALPERTRAIFVDLFEARAAGRPYDPMLGW